jgi:peptidoglycan/LPS O-acetylase OafA/YrhL
LRFLKNGCLDFETIDIYNPAGGNGPAWFLYALFFIKIFVCILTRYKIGGAVLFCVALFIGFVGYKLQLPFYVDEAFVGFPLYVTGKFLYGFLRRFFNWSLLTISVGAIFLFLFGYLSYYIVPVGTGSFYYPYYILALFCIMLCFPMILYLSEKIVNNSFLCNLFCSLGNKSLGIMLLHAPMCHTVAVILNRMFVVGSIPWIITFLFAYVIVVALSYYLTIWILKYIPILLGKI